MNKESVLRQAKKRMLKQGEHEPIVFVDTKDQEYHLPVLDTNAWNTDAFGRMKVLFSLGRAFAQSECIDSEMILSIFFVQEMWFVSRTPNDPIVHAPSEESDRREGLGLLQLRIEGRQLEQTFCMSEILRNGGIVDLAPSREPEEIQSKLLTSFLAGVASAKYNDQEFGEVMAKFAEVGEI